MLVNILPGISLLLFLKRKLHFHRGVWGTQEADPCPHPSDTLRPSRGTKERWIENPGEELPEKE